jgi:drug/metabolite transporter (DMT)-like permease
MERAIKLATLGALTGNSIFGFSFMFSRMALGVTSPFVMLMYRFILAAVLLGAIAWVCARKGERQAENGEIHWLRFSLRGRNIAPLLALGIVQPVAYFLCESYGISMTNATFSGVMIALVPTVALAAGTLVLHEIPSRAQVVWSLLSILGVVIMTLQQSAEGAIRPLGVLMLFGFETTYWGDIEWAGGYGLLLAILGPVVLRLFFEASMMFILLVKNTISINNKLKNQNKDE